MTIFSLVAVAIIAGFVFIVARRPAGFVISRSLVIPASPRAIFNVVNDFHRWEDWSPWAKLDPEAKNEFSGPSAGQGAMFRWRGNNKVGTGEMTIIESAPDNLIKIKLQFFKPMKALNDTAFLLQPEGDETRVTWTMSGSNSFIGKAMGLVMDSDKMVGSQFEQGLANLRAITAGK